jgi:GR25 family glycosyltransferase involved in LPS biosynthesis
MEYIDKVYYINLDHRIDRKEHILNELKNIGFSDDKIIRFSAISHQLGCIGCGLSHINVLKDALNNGYKNIIVFEDDFKFIINNNEFNSLLNQFITENNNYKICLLAYNLIKGEQINDYLIEAHRCQTTSGYLINHTFMTDLINTFTEAVNGLLQGKPIPIYAIDMFMMRHQGKNKQFYAIKPKMGVQITSYSDIEKRITNYGV